MVPTVSLNLHTEEDMDPIARVMTLSDGRRFVNLRLGNAEIMLPGFNADAVKHARAVVDALSMAISIVEASIEQPAEQATV